MKLLVECCQKQDLYLDLVDGIILPLENFSVESVTFFSLEEIRRISQEKKCDVFVKLNKNFMNEEIDLLKEVLLKLQELKIAGIFFYDLAVLQLKQELKLEIPLIWNQTHMVNNYKTCNYYFSKGVKYVLLGKEITLDEISEILEKATGEVMIEVVSKPSVAFSKRSLVTNYFKDLGKLGPKEILVREKVTNEKYQLVETSSGTSFFKDSIMNGTGIIKDLYDWKASFIIMREYGIESFKELIKDTKDYITNSCRDLEYVEKYKKLGDDTNFFFKKTIYKVKKNG